MGVLSGVAAREQNTYGLVVEPKQTESVGVMQH
jgi:hypothetical protein